MTQRTSSIERRLTRLSVRQSATHPKLLISRDLKNILNYGWHAPRAYECLWVDPAEVTLGFRPNRAKDPRFRFRRRDTARVIGGDWLEIAVPFQHWLKHRAVVARYRDGMSWEETGIYDWLLKQMKKTDGFDGLHSLDDIKARYALLDAAAEDARKTGRLRARAELGSKYQWREAGGVVVHIAQDGSIIRGGNGHHRCAISYALGLKIMPVQLGVVHPDALGTGVLQRLRKKPTDYPLPSNDALPADIST